MVPYMYIETEECYMLTITARNFTLTKALKDTLGNKFSKLDKFIEDGEKIDIVLDTNQNRQKIEVLLKVKGKEIKAGAKAESLYSAIDLVMDKIEKQIRRHLDKLSSVDKTSVRYEVFNEGDLEDFEVNPVGLKVIRRKVIAAKPMFEEEAIAQMELYGHKSFMFYNAETDSPSMLYKRFDGDYGLIEFE